MTHLCRQSKEPTFFEAFLSWLRWQNARDPTLLSTVVHHEIYLHCFLPPYPGRTIWILCGHHWSFLGDGEAEWPPWAEGEMHPC